MNQATVLSIIEVTGEDAVSFLQGQLTQDVALWTDAQQVRRAAWCNVKGRVWATFYIWKITGGFRLLLAADLAEKTLKRLRMFVLRAKVNLTWLEQTLWFSSSTQPVLSVNATGDQVCLLAVGTQHFGIVFEAAPTVPPMLDWDTAHIQAGIAWVSQVSSEQFVPQAVNFELVGGVNFRKGCYPGQEVVARSQYLGKLRRRAAIAQIANPMPEVMSDVCLGGSFEPVGKVILAAPGWVLFECPQDALSHDSGLFVNGAALHLQALPYLIVDITQ